MQFSGNFVYDQIFGKQVLSTNNTYIISGGMSYDDLNDNLVSKIDAITYKINGVTYTYNGGTDIPGIPLETENGMCFVSPEGLGFDTVVPPNALVIAQFSTDDTKIISWEPTGSFSLIKSIESLTELINIVAIPKGKIYVLRPESPVDPEQRRIHFVSEIHIAMYNSQTGPAVYNIINPSDFILNNNEVAYINLDKNNNQSSPIQIATLGSFNLDKEAYILCINNDGYVVFPTLQHTLYDRYEKYVYITNSLDVNETLFLNTANTDYDINGDDIFIQGGILTNHTCVYLNGILLRNNVDVTASSEYSIKLNIPLDPDDYVTVICYNKLTA